MKDIKMKKFVLILIAGFFTCFVNDCSTTQNLTSKQVSRIEQEIDSVFSIMVKAAENLDAEKLRQGVDDRYQAGFITNGVYYAQFDSLMTNFTSRSQGLLRQTISIQKKKTTVLSGSLAIVIACGETTVDAVDGRTFNAQFRWSFVYARINDQWKVIHSHQS
jgi:hypothetical protein